MTTTQRIFTSRAQTDPSQYVGEVGHMFYNETTGVLRISDGHTPGGQPVIFSTTNANIGDLIITAANISTLNTNEDLGLISNGTGNVNVFGQFQVFPTSGGGRPVFETTTQGFTQINLPTLGVGQTGLLINGDSASALNLPQVSGTTIRSIGNDGVSNTVTIDAFGTGAFPALTYRAARGTGGSPTAIQSGDTIGRLAAVGWGTTNFVIDTNSGRAASDIRFVATENYNDSHGGVQMQFYTSPNGGTVRTLSAIIAPNGITTMGNVNAANAYINHNLLVVGNTYSVGNTITIGTTLMTGNVTTSGNLNVGGNLIIVGTSINTGTTLMIGNTTTEGTTTLIGDVHITGNVDTTGAILNIGNTIINGTMTLNNQLSITGTGNLAFNDGSVQTTAAIGSINNSNHVTASLGYSGNTRVLSVTTDATSSNQPSTIVARDNVGNIAVGNISAYGIVTTASSANSSIAGNLIVFGNLNVKGTTTTTFSTAETVSGLTLTLAANAASSAAADGAGVVIGNVDYAHLLYNDTQKAWVSSVDIDPATSGIQNLGSTSRNWNNIFAQSAYLSTEINVGVQPLADYNTIAQFTSNANSYAQTITQNISNLSSASSDYIVAADVGAQNSNYTDLGINSSGYYDPGYTIGHALDGYLYNNGGNLTIGTQTTQKAIVFHTDGTLASNEAGRITQKRWVLGGTDNGTDKLQVTGTVTISGNTTVNNLITTGVTATGNITTSASSYYVGNAYLLNIAQNPTITTINNNITAANAAIATNATNIGGANSAIASTNANVTAANSAITTNTNNIATINANVIAANTNITTLFTNAGTQQTQINSLASGANANTASYLTTYSGNIQAGNISITSNAIVTANVTAQSFNINNNGIRNLGANTSPTINFATDSLVLIYNPAGTVTFSLTNFVAGSNIRALVALTANRTINFGIANAMHSTTGATSITYGGPGNPITPGTLSLDYICVDGTLANTYVIVNYI